MMGSGAGVIIGAIGMTGSSAPSSEVVESEELVNFLRIYSWRLLLTFFEG
jgi:hypothetical protein